MARFGFLINYLQPASIGCRPFLRLANTEQPPSRAVAFAAGLPVEIDLHRVVGGGGYLEPMLADVKFGTAVAALAGVAPGAQHGRHRDGPAAPHELAWESGLPDRHARGIVRLRDGLDGFADESLRHGPRPAHSAKSSRSRTALRPAAAQASSFSPPGAPLTPTAPISEPPARIGKPPCSSNTPGISFSSAWMSARFLRKSPELTPERITALALRSAISVAKRAT